jgi:hypothetical protein
MGHHTCTGQGAERGKGASALVGFLGRFLFSPSLVAYVGEGQRHEDHRGQGGKDCWGKGAMPATLQPSCLPAAQ